MATSFNWDAQALPPIWETGDGGGSWDPGSSVSWADDVADGWFVNTGQADPNFQGSEGASGNWLSNMVGNIFDWAGNNPEIVGGALSALYDAYQSDQARKRAMALKGGGGGPEPPTAAELYDKRVREHSASINRTDVGPKPLELKR